MNETDITQDRKCPKCGGDMEAGVLADNTYGGQLAQRWSKEIKFWSWTRPKGQLKITSYRCTNCGFLENFAK